MGACTPLVIDPIGTSASSKAGHRPLNMPRLTSPCSTETPLARWASRKPITAMLKTDGSPPSKSSVPSARIRSTGTPGVAPASPKYCSTSVRGNRSMPAGTGVCVVNTVDARPISSAVSMSSRGPASSTVSSRIRSMPEEAGVALVGVEHLGLRCAGDPRVLAQGAHAADAEQQLLPQPVLAVAAVQPVGDLDVVVGVALHVGVEHQQRHPADLGHPDPGDQVGPVGQRDA